MVNPQWSFAGCGLACLGGRSQSLVNPQWSFAGCGLAGVRGRFQFIVKLQVDCVGNSLVINVLHTSTVGTGFIPALAAADEKSSKCPAVGRVGINHTPTECCNHFDNQLIAKVLHTSAVGTGFIPVLPTADKIQSKCPAAARMGINLTPAPGKCTIDAWICSL